MVDLVAISLISGRKVTELFDKNVKIGFDPLDEKEPWVGRVTRELKKRCHFLIGEECSIYPGRPITGAPFPEYCLISGHSDRILQKEIFQKFPCILKPCPISPLRKAALQQLWEISTEEVFFSDFFLFGISPFVIDLKNIAGEGLEGIPISESGRAYLAHHRIEKLISRGLREGRYLDDWRVGSSRWFGGFGKDEALH